MAFFKQRKMSSPTYYFINSTRNEFCPFDDTLPILQALTNAVTKYGWVLQDDIKVESALSGNTFLIEYLVDVKKYRSAEIKKQLEIIDTEQKMFVSSIKTMFGYS